MTEKVLGRRTNAGRHTGGQSGAREEAARQPFTTSEVFLCDQFKEPRLPGIQPRVVSGLMIQGHEGPSLRVRSSVTIWASQMLLHSVRTHSVMCLVLASCGEDTFCRRL